MELEVLDPDPEADEDVCLAHAAVAADPDADHGPDTETNVTSDEQGKVNDTYGEFLNLI